MPYQGALPRFAGGWIPVLDKFHGSGYSCINSEAQTGSGQCVAIVIELWLVGHSRMQLGKDTKLSYLTPHGAELLHIRIEAEAVVGVGLSHDKTVFLYVALQLLDRGIHVQNGQNG